MIPGDPKCDDLQDHLVDLDAGEGTPEMRAHLESCAVCQARLRDSRLLRGALARLQPVPLPEDFAAQVHARLPAPLRTTAQVRPAKARAPALRWLGAAAAVAIAAGLSAVVLRFSAQPPSVDMTVAQLVGVDVDLGADRALSQVHMHIDLPEGLQLESDDAVLAAMRSLDYTTDLHAGSNRLSLVLRAARSGVHRVQVRVDAGGEQAAMDVVLRVAPNEHARAATELRFATAGLRLGDAS